MYNTVGLCHCIISVSPLSMSRDSRLYSLIFHHGTSFLLMFESNQINHLISLYLFILSLYMCTVEVNFPVTLSSCNINLTMVHLKYWSRNPFKQLCLALQLMSTQNIHVHGLKSTHWCVHSGFWESLMGLLNPAVWNVNEVIRIGTNSHLWRM